MKKRREKMIGMVLTVILLFTAGCGQGAQGESGKTPDTQNTDAGKTEETDSRDKAMGRYVETAYDLSDLTQRTGSIVKMDDGSLSVFDYNNGLLMSKDNGETWETQQPAWLERMISSNDYIMNVAVFKDGYTAVSHVPADSGENEDADGEGEETAVVDNGDGDNDFSLNPKYLLIAPDGTETKLSIPTNGDNYVNGFYFSEDGELYATSLGGEFFRVDKETASAKMIWAGDSYFYNMAIGKRYAAYINKNGFGILDLEQGEIVNDEALETFFTSHMGGSVSFANSDSVEVDLILKDDSVLYVICNRGIYRYAVGGNMVEEVAQGSITTLSNPAYEIVDSLYYDDDSFLVAFTGGKLVRYVYHPDIPALPEVEVRAYSLKENDTLKQAISAWQNKHPEYYVKYDIGMSGESPVTREDALKKLNTEIMAGNGPDFFVLDDMPLDSYIEKGILQDLTPYLADTEKELLPEMLNACRTDAGIHAVPVMFSLPLLVGENDRISSINSLSTLADQVEELRSRTQGSILGAASEEELLGMLLPVCAPAWKQADGELDTAALHEFLTQAKRIWDAESPGISEKMKESYHETINKWTAEGIQSGEIRERRQSLNVRTHGYQQDRQELAAGMLSNSWSFQDVTSSFFLEGKENGNFTSFGGQSAHVYMPKMMVGISSKSEQADAAGELLSMLLQGEGISWYDAYPVNTSCLDKEFVNNFTDSSEMSSISSSDEDGNMFSMDLFWPEEDQLARLRQIMEEADTPYVSDTVLEDAVCEIGSKVLSGKTSVEDGVKEIVSKAAIYLAE